MSKPAADRLDPALIKLAGIVVLGAMASILDLTIVNVGLDTLQREFGVAVSTVQWVTTGYALAMAIVIPVSGWAIERFGGRRMWLLALGLFLVGSSLSGLAWSIESLIAFRIVQGLGGGMLLPLAQTILTQAAGRDRLRIMPFVAVPAQLAPIVGPVIGGLLLGHASWRWIFYVNVPVCLLAIALAWRGMPRTEVRGDHKLDVRGLALLSPALALVVYGFSEAGTHGGFGAAAVLLPLAAGVALLAAFAVHALRARIEPIIDLRLLRVRGFATSSAVMFASGISLFGAMLLLPLYYQQARGASALEAGLLLAPQGLGTMVAMLVVSRLADRVGLRAVALAGMALVTAATLPFALAGADTSEALLSVALFVRGAGLGAALVPVMAACYVGLPSAAIPRATSAVRIAQQIGGALGTAALAVVLQHHLPAQPDATGIADAFDATFWWTLGFSALAFIPAALLPTGREETGPEPARAAPAPA
jgi:EmrB/QacA subfamily drug resistance transporter